MARRKEKNNCYIVSVTILYLQGAAAGAIYVHSSRYKEHNIEPDVQSSKKRFQKYAF